MKFVLVLRVWLRVWLYEIRFGFGYMKITLKIYHLDKNTLKFNINICVKYYNIQAKYER